MYYHVFKILNQTKASIHEYKKLLACCLQVEYRLSVPLVLICPVDEINSMEKLFSSNNYFGFDPEKVSVFVVE